MKYLKSLLFAMVVASFVQLPRLAVALQRGMVDQPESVAAAACKPCSTSEQLPASKEALWVSLFVREPVAEEAYSATSFPNCGDVICDAEPQFYIWVVCIKTISTPLKCQRFTHPFKAWFCPGVTYYKCYGSWSVPGADCTPCDEGTPSTLPSGCTPPVPPEWAQCV